MQIIKIITLLAILTGCNTTRRNDMTVTLIDENLTIEDTNIVETVSTFSNLDRNFTRGQQVVHGNFVYQRVGSDISAPQFDSTKTDYVVNDLVFTDKLKYVSKTTGTQPVAIQPELYTNDVSIESNAWQHRYLKVGTFSNGKIEKSANNGDNTYSYTFTNNSGDITTSIVKRSDSSVQYVNSNSHTNIFTILGTVGSDGYLYSRNSNGINTLYKLTSNLQLGIYYIKGNTKYKAHTDVNNYSKENYSASSWRNLSANDVLETTMIHHFSIVQQINAETVNTIQATYQSFLATGESPATITDNYIFTPKSFIIRGNDLYMRTNVDIEQQAETVDITEVEIADIISPNTIDWGWSILRPTMKHALLDSEKNTKMRTTSDIFLNLKSSVKFDTVVLNDVIASEIIVTVDGFILPREPKNVLEMNGKSITAPTKTVIYLNRLYDANTTIHISIKTLNGIVELGGVYIGEKFTIGKTAIPFTKKYEPIDTLSYDAFGNATFVNRAVVKKYSSTVVFPSIHFDFLDAFMGRIAGGKKAVFDGTDNLKNIDGDTNKIKSSTIMVGRLLSNPLSFLAKNGRDSDYSEMKVEIREDV